MLKLMFFWEEGEMLRCRLGLLCKIFSFTVLNCFLGENFTNITSISSNGGTGECCAFFKLHMRTTNSVVELWPFPKPQLLQPSHLPVLVHRLADLLGVRIPSNSLMEWITEDNLNEFIHRIFTNPVRTQNSQSPTVACGSLLRNRLKVLSKLQLVSTMSTGHRAHP